MKRGVLLGLVVALLLPVARTWASDARIQSLGVQFEYVEDYILFQLFPTVAARYPNLVTAGLGNRSEQDRAMGVIASTSGGKFGSLALFLNDLGLDGGQDAQLDVVWAKNIGSTTVGAGLIWTRSSLQVGDVVVGQAFQMSADTAVDAAMGHDDRVP